jgi:hypothetical protein
MHSFGIVFPALLLYHNRILRWAGHVARMPMKRVPRQLLTGWGAHLRPNGCPEMTWGRTLTKALKCRGLPVNFKEWRAIAKDRSERGLRTYSKPVPPSVNWPYRAHGSEDEHCITQKDTQPSAHFLFTISTCAQRTRVPFCPKHWHSGLY